MPALVARSARCRRVIEEGCVKAKQSIVMFLAVAVAAVAAVAPQAAQSTADAAARLTGSWKLNRELSPGFGGGRGRGSTRYEIGFFPQGRGGGGGGQDAGDMTPAELDAAKAIRELQALPDQMKIEASETSVTFTDVRGARTYAVDDKAIKIDAGVTKINGKSKWDKGTLRQEFSSPATKVIYLWTPSADGKQLSFTMKIEDARQPREQKAVFDKQ
jgi:hypothetical protein